MFRSTYVLKTTAFLFFLLFFFSLAAQPVSKEGFRGKVIDATTKEPLSFVIVQLPDHSLWAITNDAGFFSIPKVKKGTYRCEVSLLGYQKIDQEVEIDPQKETLFTLSELTLALDDVVVVAEEQKLGSTSKIDQTAIKHIQAQSVEDLLQLLPGGLTKNPDLNRVGQASLREVSGDANNALGTSILLDGAPLSNDANLQRLSTTKASGEITSQQVSGKGIDLRSLSPDNIESLEVIRGIPSVEYGNLTAGGIVIKTRSGATPSELKFKTDPSSKLAFVSKGVALAKNRGNLNLSVDYSSSYADTRKRYNGFDRLTSSLGYSNTFFKVTKPLSFNLRFSYFRNMNHVKSDPQLKLDEKIENRYQGIRLNTYGEWRVNNAFLSTLSYTFMVNSSRQEDIRRRQILLQSGITPIANALEDGEYQTHFLNASYYSDYRIDGKPLDIYSQVKLKKTLSLKEELLLTFMLGADWNYNKNRGEGLLFDPNYPPEVRDIQSVRPRSFKDIPAMNSLAAFFENKIYIPFGKRSLLLQAGVRYTHLFLDKLAQRGDMHLFDPRLNFEYALIKAGNFVENLSLVGGVGCSSKLPTLMYLYPDRAYFDVSSFNRMFPTDLSKSLAVMTTKVVEHTANPNLKPMTSKKIELGIQTKVKQVRANLTFFYEQYKREFGLSTRPLIMPYTRYEVPSSVDGVFYQDHQVYYEQNEERFLATAVPERYLFTYRVPANSSESVKRGVEYSLNLGELPLLKTSVIIDGTWLSVKRKHTTPSYKQLNDVYAGELYPYIALMPAGGGTKEERINTNLRLITHLPKLKTIFSTTAQFIFLETQQRIYEDEAGKSIYYKQVDPFHTENQERYFVDPLGFVDKHGAFTEWNKSYNETYKYYLMRNRYAHRNYFGKEKFPATVMLNFRLTKEVGQLMELSFVANNFLKLSKAYKYSTSAGYRELLLPIYFGAELKIKL